MDNRPCHSLNLNGERILNLYPKSSGVLLTDGDEEGSVAIPTALVYDLILALHDYKDGPAAPPTTEARWKEIAQERGDMLDDLSRQLAQVRAEVEQLRPLAHAARTLSQACADEGAYLADKASDEGWLATEKAIKAVWDAAPAVG